MQPLSEGSVTPSKYAYCIFCTGSDVAYPTYFALGNMLSIQQIGKHVRCPRADVALGLRPRDIINPLCNITCVYQLPMCQL